MNILAVLLLTTIAGPILEWEPLPNRTIEITLPGDRRIYRPIIEIGLCANMRYTAADELILRAGRECYRVSTQPFEIKK